MLETILTTIALLFLCGLFIIMAINAVITMKEKGKKMEQCDLCTNKAELTHLALYINGSEGVNVCLPCRMVLTNVASGMKRIKTTAIMAIKKGKG